MAIVLAVSCSQIMRTEAPQPVSHVAKPELPKAEARVDESRSVRAAASAATVDLAEESPGRLEGLAGPKSKRVSASPAPRPAATAPAGAHAANKRFGMVGLVADSALSPRQKPAEEQDFNTEGYNGVEENPWKLVTEAPLSTFSVDVDTASYSNMRRFVRDGRMPPPESIRVEEWVNYFAYADPTPVGTEPFAVATEVSECPWNSSHELVRVALTTARISQDQVPGRNLVFLIDVSGSMQPANKLPLLKRGLAMLARQLRPADTLSIVVYAGSSGLVLPPTSGAEQSKILETLQNLESGGSTNGAQGIELAYRVAREQFKRGGINRVILATDGDFNVGVTSEGALQRLIEEKRKTGIFLTVLGFGEGNVKDSTMELLADKGNGNYAYVDSLAEARKVLVQEAGATLVTVAQDVKLQLEFNPRRVKSYRLVGYENRVLADQDFNDDTKDAGEIGAGHHVTAFYEVVPAGAPSPSEAPRVDPLKYQTVRGTSAAAATSELATVKIRYKPPGGQTSLLASRGIVDAVVPLRSASESLRFGVAVAEFGLSLRGSKDLPPTKLDAARRLAEGAIGSDPTGERREFLALMDRASHFATR